MFLDIKTASLLSAALSFLLSYFMYVVYKKSPTIKGPYLWMYNNFFNCLGQLFFILAGKYSIGCMLVLANFFSAMGDSFFVAGLWAFMNKPIRWILLGILTLLMLLQTITFIYLIPDATLRRVMFSVILILICSLSLKTFFAKSLDDMKTSLRFSGYLILIFIIALFIRGLLIAIYKQNELLESSLPNNIVYSILLIVQVGIAIGSILMVNNRIASELRLINQGKNVLYSVISHDLKGPVQMIHTFMEHLLNPNLAPNKKEQILQLLKDMSESTYGLLENLLEWTRNQTGDISYQPELLFLKELINHSLGFLNTMAKTKSITITIEISPTHQIFADRQMMTTVFRNLIMNALKFTHQGGIIEISSKEEKSNVTLVIKDSGVGMSQHQLNHLFEMSAYKTSRGTNKESGSGLGLILCKQFVEKNNGSIRFESIQDKGTSVYLFLPKL